MRPSWLNYSSGRTNIIRLLRTARPRAEQNPFAECHRSGGDLNCARQQNGNEGCRMENGRQLKIQSELARERRSEGGIEGVGTERARRGIGVNVTRAGNGEKDRKRQTVGRILQRSARPFRTHPTAENNGQRMRLLFHFWIRDRSCGLVCAFFFPAPRLFISPCSFVFPQNTS